MLFDKVLSQTLSTDIWRATTKHMQIIRQRLSPFSWPLGYLITSWILTPDTL